MLKYCETQVNFREIPDEISLCINISNCPCNCPGCHSRHLAMDIGEVLDIDSLQTLIDKNKGISCVAFMGGDAEPEAVDRLSAECKKRNPSLKTAWYSGRADLSDKINISNFDFIKIGPYIEKYGPLDCKTTNQIFYRIEKNELINITDAFWRKKI